MADLDLETIRHALEIARKGGFGEVQLESGTSTFSGKLSGAQVSTHAKRASLNGEAPEIAESLPALKAISAVCVGFYKPGDKALKVGAKVAKGDIVATITALGLANDVESPVSGEIVEVLASPEQPVEYGQPLAMVREE